MENIRACQGEVTELENTIAEVKKYARGFITD